MAESRGGNIRLKRTSSARGRSEMTSNISSSFLPPAHSSTMIESAGSSRRGITPSKTVAEPLPPPRPKLTPAQQLAIIDRIENNDFARGVGISQFYEQFSEEKKANTGVAKNLSTAFANATLLESKPNASAAQDSDNSDLVHANFRKIDEDYSKLPSYIKLMDKVYVLKASQTAQIQSLIETSQKAKFNKLLPQNLMAALLTKIDKIVKIISATNKKTPWEFVKLFNEEKLKKQSQDDGKMFLHCDVRNQEKLVAAIIKCSKVLKGFEECAIDKDKPINLDNVLEKLEKALEEVEEQLIKEELLVNENLDLEAKADAINGNSDSDESDTDGSP